jgi:hypothetical protein
MDPRDPRPQRLLLAALAADQPAVRYDADPDETRTRRESPREPDPPPPPDPQPIRTK